MIGIFKPSPDAPRLPADKIDPTYRRLRWQVFAGIFFGYAAYYFVRSNFDLAQKGLIEAGCTQKPSSASSVPVPVLLTVCPNS